MGVAPVSFVKIHPVRNAVNTFRQNRHYACSTYFIENNFVMALHASATTIHCNSQCLYEELPMLYY